MFFLVTSGYTQVLAPHSLQRQAFDGASSALHLAAVDLVREPRLDGARSSLTVKVCCLLWKITHFFMAKNRLSIDPLSHFPELFFDIARIWVISSIDMA